SGAAAADMEIIFPFRRPKRYSLRRNDKGYEIRDADAQGAQVFFSTSRREAHMMVRALNRKPGTDEKRVDQWKGGSGAGGGWGGGWSRVFAHPDCQTVPQRRTRGKSPAGFS